MINQKNNTKNVSEKNKNALDPEIAEKLNNGIIHLEYGEWDEAYDIFDDLLYYHDDIEEVFLKAYPGKLCAELQINSINEFIKSKPEIVEDKGEKAFTSSVETKAGYYLLLYNDWSNADIHFNKAIKSDIKCARAYIGKLMAQYKIRSENEIESYLWNHNINLSSDVNYNKALDFADEEYKKVISKYVTNHKSNSLEKKESYETLKKKRAEISKYKKCIVATSKNTHAMTVYGTVFSAGSNQFGQCGTYWWDNIVSIAAGEYNIIGLKKDGTVTSAGAGAPNGKGASKCVENVGQGLTSNWTDIKQIAVSNNFTVGLKRNGSIVTCGDALKNRNNSYGTTSGYLAGVGKNILGNVILPKMMLFDSVYASPGEIVGINQDRTVYAMNSLELCKSWCNITKIVTSDSALHIVGITSNKTVVVARGSSSCKACDVSNWTNIVDVAIGGTGFSEDSAFTVGLRADGTVVAVGCNDYGQCDVSEWRNIVSIAVGAHHTIGLRVDGTVVATKWKGVKSTDYDGQCEVSEWDDIIAVFAGRYHTVGLKANGTVVAVGCNENGQCNTQGWSEIGVCSTENEDKRREAEQVRLSYEERKAYYVNQRQKFIDKRTALFANFNDQTQCLNCGKKHLFTVKVCKKCGALNESGFSKNGLNPFRSYKLPNYYCKLFKDGYFDTLTKLDTGKEYRIKLTDIGEYYEFYSNSQSECLSDLTVLLDNGNYYLMPKDKNEFIQNLRPDGTVAFFRQIDNKYVGIYKEIFPGGFVREIDFKNENLVT